MKTQEKQPLKRKESTIFALWAEIEQRNCPNSVTGFDKKAYANMMIELQDLFIAELKNERKKTKEIEKESIKMATQLNNSRVVIKNLLKRLKNEAKTLEH